MQCTSEYNGILDIYSWILQIHKIIGFAPTLLQVVMSNEVDVPVRQAGK